MGAVPIIFPLSTAPGASPLESGGRLINSAAEPLGDGRATRHRRRRALGLDPLGIAAELFAASPDVEAMRGIAFKQREVRG